MDQFEAMAAARVEFDKRIRAVRPDQWQEPTPCEAWSVRDLVQHVVGANRMTVRLLAGAEASEAVMAMTGPEVLGDDPVAAFVESAEQQEARFREPGALERTCHHPIGDIPGAMLLGFRVTDMTLHAWDLARAVGVDEQLDAALVEAVWARLEPIAAFVTATGMFGAGPSGEVGEDASLQARLLDLSGRRP